MIYLFRRALPGGSSFRIRILSAHVWPEETCPFLILFFAFACFDARSGSFHLGLKIANFQRAFPLKPPCWKW